MLPENERLLTRLLKEQQSRFFAEGEAKGEAKGKAQAVLQVLERRGIATSAEQRERVLACSDLATLETWLDRAAVAKTAQEAFAD